jgi:methionyl-tRNA synthetase
VPSHAYFVTTPIYYVNDVPHIGTAYTTTLADVVARYRRGLGEDVHFLTGTDEHGQKAQEAAERRGVTPEAYCEEMQQRFRDTWARLGIRYDDFLRTTEPRHVRVVQAVLSALHRKGELYRGEYEGWYHVSDEVFVTEKEIEEKGLDRAQLRRLSEPNWFFRMGRRRDEIREAIASRRFDIHPAQRRNEVLGFLEKDLGDLCISRPRARLSWGIPLPFDPEYVTYVWFDALLNYLTGAGYLQDDARFERLWPAVHLIGKDIVTTHCVYWPAMLLAAGVALPRKVVAHGWWVVAGAKMSKSVGNVVAPLAYAERYGADALRYFLMREMAVGQDADFSDERFRARYEGDLANSWGNLLSRTLTMIGRYAEGRIPSAGALDDPAFAEVRAAVEASEALVRAALDAFQVERVCEHAIAVARAANALAEREQPWKAAKDPARAGRVATVLYVLAEAVRVSSALLAPVVPAKAAEALRQLGAPPADDLPAALRLGVLVAGTPVAPGPVLFPRVE